MKGPSRSARTPAPRRVFAKDARAAGAGRGDAARARFGVGRVVERTAFHPTASAPKKEASAAVIMASGTKGGFLTTVSVSVSPATA